MVRRVATSPSLGSVRREAAAGEAGTWAGRRGGCVAAASAGESRSVHQQEGGATWLQQLARFWDVRRAIEDNAVGLNGNKGGGGEAGVASPEKRLRVVLGRIARLAAPDKGVLAFAFTFLLFASLSELGIPYLVSRCLVTAAEGAAGQAVFKQSVLMLGGLALSYGVFSGLRGFAFSIANQRMVRRLRDGTYRALISQEQGWLDQQNIGELTSRLNSDTNTVANCLGLNVNIMLRNALQAVGGALLLLQLNRELAAVTACVTALYLLLSDLYGRYSRRLASAVQDAIAATNQVAEETLVRAANVRVFGAEEREVQRYRAHSHLVYQLRLRSAGAWGLFHGLSSIIFNSTKAVALTVGGAALAAGTTSPAELTTFVLYVDMVVSASLAVCEQWAQVLETVGASERVMELLARPPAPQLAPGTVPPMELYRGHVRFENVSFRYPARPEVLALDNVSFSLAPGTVTAFVGGSGSGKSTVAKLVQRLYDPDDGQVTLDGACLTTLDSVWYRTLLGVVSQDPKLFPSDVRSNICYGDTDAPTERVEAAAALASADGFISRLPEKYGTPVGEGRLSGGQQQRVAIARALIRTPRLLILDEATSALDARSEAKVQAALDSLLHDDAVVSSVFGRSPPTALVIAHKLASIQNADLIVVMDEGRVREKGTHAELMAARGTYCQLWEQQAHLMKREYSFTEFTETEAPPEAAAPPPAASS